MIDLNQAGGAVSMAELLRTIINREAERAARLMPEYDIEPEQCFAFARLDIVLSLQDFLEQAGLENVA